MTRIQLETKRGRVATLSNERLTNDPWRQPWTVIDDSEGHDIRLNAYLAGVQNDLDQYGVAVNRYWDNRTKAVIPGLSDLMIVDDLVRAPYDFAQMSSGDWRAQCYEYEHDTPRDVCFVADQDIPRGVVLGRVVILGEEAVDTIDRMMRGGAEPSEVTAVIAEERQYNQPPKCGAIHTSME